MSQAETLGISVNLSKTKRVFASSAADSCASEHYAVLASQQRVYSVMI